jgi:hypothetical protein
MTGRENNSLYRVGTIINQKRCIETMPCWVIFIWSIVIFLWSQINYYYRISKFLILLKYQKISSPIYRDFELSTYLSLSSSLPNKIVGLVYIFGVLGLCFFFGFWGFGTLFFFWILGLHSYISV